MFCQNCGSVLPAGARFCTECGTPVPPAEEESAPRESEPVYNPGFTVPDPVPIPDPVTILPDLPDFPDYSFSPEIPSAPEIPKAPDLNRSYREPDPEPAEEPAPTAHSHGGYTPEPEEPAPAAYRPPVRESAPAPEDSGGYGYSVPGSGSAPRPAAPRAAVRTEKPRRSVLSRWWFWVLIIVLALLAFAVSSLLGLRGSFSSMISDTASGLSPREALLPADGNAPVIEDDFPPDAGPDDIPAGSGGLSALLGGVTLPDADTEPADTVNEPEPGGEEKPASGGSLSALLGGITLPEGDAAAPEGPAESADVSEPVHFIDAMGSDGTPAYIDLIGISDWVYRDGGKRYYAAEDESYFYIVSVTDEQLAEMEEEQVYWDRDEDSEDPPVYHLTGVMGTIDSDTREAFKEVFDLNDEDFDYYFGDDYLDAAP